MNLTVVHHIPGRIRWRSANCFTRSLAETIAEKLDALAGIRTEAAPPRLSPARACAQGSRLQLVAA